MSIASELASICRELRMLGDDELANKALCAYAAATGADKPQVDLSYSYLMRKLRKGDKERRLKFQKVFKEAFDRALYEDVDEPAGLALMVAMKAIDYKEDDA
jgi:hypothetical protein